MPLIYVLPVHNESAVLADNVTRLCGVLAGHAGSTVLLVENGSQDDSAALARGLARDAAAVPVHAFSLPVAGIGHAYDHGIREALGRVGPSSEHWLVLTAADLPFAFTDLAQALPHLGDTRGPLLIGSKAHPQSIVHVSAGRTVMTRVYRELRRAVAGMCTGDSQGSLFLRLDVAAQLVDLVRARDFFYSTELVFHAERLRHPIVELPVTVVPGRRGSTVRPLRHGTAMLLALLRLVRAWGRVAPPS